MGDKVQVSSPIAVKPDIDELIYGDRWDGPSDR